MSTISIKLGDISATPVISHVTIETPLNDHESIWVWDHFFSYALHQLSDSPASEELLETMSHWAIKITPHLALSLDEFRTNNDFVLSDNIRLSSSLPSPSIDKPLEETLIEATSQENQWPNIHIRLAPNASDESIQTSVMALGQFFLNTHPNFYRELPLHVLAMRKFYQNHLPYHDEESLEQAPTFAVNMALQFQKQLSSTH